MSTPQPRLNNGRPLSEERKALAEACLDDGWSFRQITLTHRISSSTLRRHFPGRAMNQKEAAAIGAMARKLSLVEKKKNQR